MKSRIAGIGAAAALMTAAALIVTTWCVPPGAAAAKRRAPRAKKPAAAADSNQVLVRIGKRTITRADVEHRIASLPQQFRANYTTPDGRRQLLQRMVEEQVWLAEALQHGVEKRPEVREQIEQQRRDLLIRAYLTDLMAENPAPSDSEARAYYDQHLDDYRVPASITVRHIRTKSESEAKRVKHWASRKYDWNKLVEQFSTDTLTKKNGGSLGTISKDGVFSSLGRQPALAESAFALPAGAIGGPYETDHGWEVLKIDAVQPESTRPFDQMRPVIMRQLSSQRSQDYYQKRLKEAKDALQVQPDSSAINDFVAVSKSARDLFNEAQALEPPQDRIDAYRKLLSEYPDSDVSPQAQFMIGFIYSEELKNYDQAEKAFRALLKRYPKAELAASAQWMIDHMRDPEAPSFIDLSPDSTGQAASPAKKGVTVKP